MELNEKPLSETLIFAGPGRVVGITPESATSVSSPLMLKLNKFEVYEKSYRSSVVNGEPGVKLPPISSSVALLKEQLSTAQVPVKLKTSSAMIAFAGTAVPPIMTISPTANSNCLR